MQIKEQFLALIEGMTHRKRSSTLAEVANELLADRREARITDALDRSLRHGIALTPTVPGPL